MSAESSEDVDWYKVLGCTLGSSREVIEKAARKLSAKFHPDKNPDPAAAPVFLKIQKAKDFLLDDEKRKEYDNKIRAALKRKEYDMQRNQNMDSKRKKLKEEFEVRMKEERERVLAKASGSAFGSGKVKTAVDLDQFRKANFERREQAASEMRERDQKKTAFMEQRKALSSEIGHCQVKIKWKRTHQSHSDESLYQMFKVFGSIEEVTLVGDKGNTAVLTFTDESSAGNAVDHYATAEDMRVSIITDAKNKSSIFSHVYEKPELPSLDKAKLNADDLLFRMKRKQQETEAIFQCDYDENPVGNAVSDDKLREFFDLEKKVLSKMLSSLTVQERDAALAPLLAAHDRHLDQR